ncbi:MAG: (d)CMP kinase [Alphaproteobacteria bacterium]|nr:(d)CMP kinase [Alphaproteobacteria bacterium]MBL6952623.1 (d)CMP kinase [Alphaproteobacteria bacterium]
MNNAPDSRPEDQLVIAVDGPVAAGKGTLGRRLAAHLGFAYLDTGGLYRAVALRMLRDGQALDDVPAMVAQAQAISLADLDDPALREERVGEAASVISPEPALRAALLLYQRNFAAHPPHGAAGAVLDGRDIGTVVCPGAAVKLFVTASAEARAKRRHAELLGRGEDVSLATVQADLANRDARDMERSTSPLAAAADAHLLDTTKMDIEAAVQAARKIVAACTKD